MPDQRMTIDDVVAMYTTEQILEGVRIQLQLRKDESLQETFVAAYCKHYDAQRNAVTAMAVAREMELYRSSNQLPYTVTRQFLDYLIR